MIIKIFNWFKNLFVSSEHKQVKYSGLEKFTEMSTSSFINKIYLVNNKTDKVEVVESNTDRALYFDIDPNNNIIIKEWNRYCSIYDNIVAKDHYSKGEMNSLIKERFKTVGIFTDHSVTNVVRPSVIVNVHYVNEYKNGVITDRYYNDFDI
jgi:hypothetical protein